MNLPVTATEKHPGTTIRSIRLIGLSHTLPNGLAYGMSRGMTPCRQTTLVELTTEDGVVGIGEAWGMPALNAAYLAVIKPFYLGRRVFDHELAWYDIISRLYHLGIQNQMIACMSGIDMAARDAIGKQLGVGVCDLLGGRGSERIPVYASGGYFANQAHYSLEHQLEPLAGQGHKRVKIKIGRSPQDDQDRVARSRIVLGDDFELLVDTNGNYSPDLVLDSMRRIAPYNIGWYEEPLPPQDFQGLQRLREQALIPVATGEALYTAFDFNRLLEARQVDVLQPDITLCGGLGQARHSALQALQVNLRVSPHVWGSAVGLAAACHFVASLPTYPHGDNNPAPTLIEYDIGINPLRDELLSTPLTAQAGEVAVPTGAGLGIELDPDAVAKYQTEVY